MAAMVAKGILARRAVEGSPCHTSSQPFSELMGEVQRLGLDACAVLDELNAVLYGTLGFRQSSHEEYYEDSNSYIDQVQTSGVCFKSLTTHSWRGGGGGNFYFLVPFLLLNASFSTSSSSGA